MHMRKSIRLFLLTFLTLAALCIMGQAADVKLGSISTSGGLKLRSEPSTEASVLDTGYVGDRVVVWEKTGDWYRVTYNYKEGYMFAEYLTLEKDGDAKLGQGLITGSTVNVRQEPSTEATRLTQMSKGDRIDVVGVQAGWFKVKTSSGKEGYIHADYLQIVKPAASKSSPSSSSDSAGPSGEPITQEAAIMSAPAEGSDTDKLLTFSKQFIGSPYRSGGASPKGFDCSGFVYYCYKNALGITLNRSSTGMMSNGTTVNRDSLQPGDLVLFRDANKKSSGATHVGIVVGRENGKIKFIHAANAKLGVRYNTLSDTYYSKWFIGGRRILG